MKAAAETDQEKSHLVGVGQPPDLIHLKSTPKASSLFCLLYGMSLNSQQKAQVCLCVQELWSGSRHSRVDEQ